MQSRHIIAASFILFVYVQRILKQLALAHGASYQVHASATFGMKFHGLTGYNHAASGPLCLAGRGASLLLDAAHIHIHCRAGNRWSHLR